MQAHRRLAAPRHNSRHRGNPYRLPHAGRARIRGAAAARSDSEHRRPSLDSTRQGAAQHQERHLYYPDAVSLTVDTSPLELGQVQSKALPFESYQLAFTPGLAALLVSKSASLAAANPLNPSDITAKGFYTQPAFKSGAVNYANYWVPSGHLKFDPNNFYLPVEAVDPFGQHHFVTYDAYQLLIVSTKDPLGNIVQANNDYRVLAPSKVTDANLNRNQVTFDALGRVTALALMGKDVTDPSKQEGDTSTDPTVKFEYHLDVVPAYVKTSARERHRDATTPWQDSYTYSDGFGRIVQQKVQAEPGDAPLRDSNGVLQKSNGKLVIGPVTDRWVGTGRTVYNNKGNPVKQFEPFFSSTYKYESETDLVEWGVTPIIHYDPLDRAIQTDLPNGCPGSFVGPCRHAATS